MNTLSKLNSDLESVRRDQSKCAAQLAEIGAERYEKSSPGGKAAAVVAAEQHLIEQLAARELGESHDVPAAEKSLADAKALPDDGFERAARLRVLDTLKARHDAEHVALHEKGLSIMAAIKRVEDDALISRGADLLAETEAAMILLARNAGLLEACKSLVVERGATWPHAVLNEAAVAYRNQLTPNQARAEIVSALAI